MISALSVAPAHPGDTLTIFALGCAPTNPATQAGVVAAQNAPLAVTADVRIGGIPATVTDAGIVASTIGVYRINRMVTAVSNGDQPIKLIVDGVRNNQALSIVVGQ